MVYYKLTYEPSAQVSLKQKLGFIFILFYYDKGIIGKSGGFDYFMHFSE